MDNGTNIPSPWFEMLSWCKETGGKTHAGPKRSTIGCPAERKRQLWNMKIWI